MLHTLHRSPWYCDFHCLLRTLAKDDDLLLLQDGVTAALQGSLFLPLLQATPARVSLLQDDVLARGLSEHISQQFALVSYADFVALCVAQPCQMSW